MIGIFNHLSKLFGRNNLKPTKMNTYKAKLNEDGNYELFTVEQGLSDDLVTPINVAKSEGISNLAALESDLDRLSKEVATIQAKVDAINAIAPATPVQS